MIVDITNELLTVLKSELTGVDVLTSYPETPPNFSCITFEEGENTSNISTKDSSGFNHSNISFEINIFTVGNSKMSKAKVIRNKIDKILSGTYGLNRNASRSVPNYLNNSVYRYNMRYSGIIDKNKVIYGR